MRLPGFLAIALASFVAAFAATLLLPHDPYVRFQSFQGTMFGRLQWAYERIHFDPQPVDVVILGASREAGGISPAMVEAELAALGHPMRVANFSLPSSGMDVRLIVLQELFKEKRPKLVVISVVERLPRDGHQVFGDLATPLQTLTAPLLTNRNLPRNIARLPVRQMELALVSLSPDQFGYHAAFAPSRYEGSARELRLAEVHGDTANAPERANLSAETLAANTAMRKREMRAPILPDALSDVEFGVSRHYLRATKDLAEAHGARVVFVFLPIFNGYPQPLDRKFIDTLGPIITSAAWMHDPDAYRDEGHTRTEMKPHISRWFAGELVKQLGDER